MLKILRILIGAIFAVPVIIVSMIPYLIVKLLRRCGARKASDTLMWICLRFLAHWIMFFFGARFRIVGKENIPKEPGKYCYIGNHQSMFDIVALLMPMGLHLSFIGKIEVKKIPIINCWFDALEAVYLDRKNPRQSIKAIIDGSRMIESGKGMNIFPEGTRSRDGKIHEFKAGSFKMATRVGAIIVPVVCKGTRSVFEAGNSLLPRKVYLQFLPWIDTSKLSAEELPRLSEKVHDMIQEAYDKLPPVKGFKALDNA